MGNNNKLARGLRSIAIHQMTTTRIVFRRLLAVVMFALVIGNLAPDSPVQAAHFPAGNSKVKFEMRLYGEGPFNLCKNAFEQIRVLISREAQVVMNGNPRPVYSILSGVTVNASSSNTNIGTLRPSHSMTSFEDGVYDMAGFVFIAKKAGSTTITFKAKVKNFWVADGAQEKNTSQTDVPDKQVQITVVDCPVHASIKSHWKVPGLAYSAIVDETDLTADENGNYTGTGTAHWVGSWQVIPAGLGSGISCTANLTAPDSQVDLTGTANEDGYLDVKIKFQQSKSPKWSAVCKDASGSTPPSITQVQLAAAPLHTVVPASTGGVSTRVQDLGDQISAGSAFIDIFVEDNQAASFQPDTLMAQLPSSSAWLLMSRDVFTRIFNFLPALW